MSRPLVESEGLIRAQVPEGATRATEPDAYGAWPPGYDGDLSTDELDLWCELTESPHDLRVVALSKPLDALAVGAQVAGLRCGRVRPGMRTRS